jgi:HK97 family phage major capsid protein
MEPNPTDKMDMTVGEFRQAIADAQAKGAAESRRNFIPPGIAGEARTVERTIAQKRVNALKFARCVRAQALGELTKRSTVDVLKTLQRQDKSPYGDEAIALVEKAPQIESILADGGIFVEEDISTDFIDLLRPMTIVRNAGATVVDMPKGNKTLNKRASAPNFSYIGETGGMSKGKYTYASLKLSAKKAALAIVISNDLIRDSSGKADSEVLDQLLKDYALGEDSSFLFGSGTEYAPKGLENWIASGSKFGISGSTYAAALADLIKAISKVDTSNVVITKGAWFMHPRVKWWLMGLVDGNGNAVFGREMQERNTLLTFPFYTTTQIPANLGGGGNESKIFFGNAPSMIIGDQMPIETTADPGATFTDDGGYIVSCRETDQTLITALARHDFALEYDTAFSQITGVTWGA